MNLHSIILSLFLQHDSGASMGGRQIPSIVSVWAEQYERFLVFSKATQSEMLHFATCQELLRLAKAWFWDMKPLFTAFKWSTAMLSFSIYRFVSKPRLCHPDVAGPEGEDFYNFRCLAHPLHRLYPETARERESEREWCWWDVHQHHVRRFAFCWTTRGSCFQIRKSGRIMMLRLSCSLKDMEWLAVRNQFLQVLLVQEVNSLPAFLRLAKPANLMKIAPPVSTDLSPTWKGARKTLRLGCKRWQNHGKKM